MTASTPWHCGSASGAIIWRCSCVSYLSPDIVRAILAGQQPIELTPTRLVALSRNLPHDWQDTKRLRAPQAAVLRLWNRTMVMENP
jgi:hypothetical protein